jgi:hypothetical protein
MAKKNPRTPERPESAAPPPPPITRRRLSAAPRPEAADLGAGPFDPTHAEIAEAAYQRYLNRGRVHGRDFDDWLEAERELRDQRIGTVTSRRRDPGL